MEKQDEERVLPRKVLESQLLAKAVDVENDVKQFIRLRYALMYHKNLRGDAMVFSDKPYLVPIYKDNAQEIVLQSSVQTGKSEFLIIAALSYAELGMQVLYAFPTIELRNLFVANRIDNQIARIPYYQEQMQIAPRSSDARGLKNYGKGAIFFGGSNSGTTFIEKPLDVIIADELDRFDLNNYAKADDRLTASPHKIKYEASNPTVDKFGIHRRFLQSDQRLWKIQCPSCNVWQAMDWFKNVVEQYSDNMYRLKDREWNEFEKRDINMYCRKCDGLLERFTHRSAWIPKHFGKDVHGYHIHQMLSSYVSIRSMWRKFQLGTESDTDMQVFYNSMLGLTFAGAGSKLTDDALNKCKENYSMPVSLQEPCVMGIDVGKKLHIVVRQILPGEETRLVYAGTAREFEEIDYLFSRFKIVGYCVDARPETRKSTELAKKHPGRGWMCEYMHGLRELTKDDEQRICKADRTMLMDKVMNKFTQGFYKIPANAHTIDNGDYYDQMKTPTRVYDAEKDRYDWLGDPDHYYHAEVYCYAAYLLRGEFRVVGISVGAQAVENTVSEPPKSFPTNLIPPGTDPAIARYYQDLYEKAKKGYTGFEDA